MAARFFRFLTRSNRKAEQNPHQRLPCVKGAVSRRLTEGLLSHQRFPPLSNPCSRSPEYGSALKISFASKAALLTSSSGFDEAWSPAPDRLIQDLSTILLPRATLQSRFARQLPLHRGAFAFILLRASFSHPCRLLTCPKTETAARCVRRHQKPTCHPERSEGSRMVTPGTLTTGFFVASLLRMTGGRERRNWQRCFPPGLSV